MHPAPMFDEHGSADVWIVAEMMSADWGRDQVVLAAEAGADVEASRRRSWDILVVGRGVTDSLDPAVAARDLAASIELTEGHHQ